MLNDNLASLSLFPLFLILSFRGFDSSYSLFAWQDSKPPLSLPTRPWLRETVFKSISCMSFWCECRRSRTNVMIQPIRIAYHESIDVWQLIWRFKFDMFNAFVGVLIVQKRGGCQMSFSLMRFLCWWLEFYLKMLCKLLQYLNYRRMEGEESILF